MQSDVDAWEALEADFAEQEELQVDLVRIRGFAIACANQAERSKTKLDEAVALMMRAREKAERERVRCTRVCDFAERACSFAARAMANDVDPATRREAACALEEMFG